MNRRRVRSVGGDSEIEEIRSAVQAAIESVAPEVDTPHLRSDAPLRRQIDLDSLDWLNVIAGLGERLSLEIPESDYERLGTLDSILADVASRQTERAGKPMRATAGAAADLLSTRYVVGGTPVTVRPIRADDAPLEADFVRHLSIDTRYKRFIVMVSGRGGGDDRVRPRSARLCLQQRRHVPCQRSKSKDP